MLEVCDRPHHPPVVLVHGIDDTIAVFNKLSAYLKQRGFDPHALNLVPNNGNADFDTLGKQLAAFVQHTITTTQVDASQQGDRRIILIGFSMGGIVSRYYVQRLGGIDRVRHLVTISSPHNGTWAAYLRQNPGCQQMRPGSAFLQDLNRDVALLDGIQFTNLWTPFDATIVPANSSQLPVGKEIQIPVALHPWMLTDKRSMAAIADAITHPEPSMSINTSRVMP